MFETFRLTQFMLAAEEHAAEAGASGEHHTLNMVGLMTYLGLVLVILFFLLANARKGLKSKFFTKRLTQYGEQLYGFLEGLCLGIIGPHGKRYMPMVMTFWLVIFVSNIVSLFFATAPTADISFNLGMALIAIGYVQYEGMRANGVIGHFKHFAGPQMGIGLIFINVMIFIIEIISEAMKNVSLSLRLFGNIDGGHKAAEAMNELGASIFVPFGAFLLPVKLLTCIVQALIFCLLFCVYLSLVTHHDDHGHDSHDAHDPEPIPA